VVVLFGLRSLPRRRARRIWRHAQRGRRRGPRLPFVHPVPGSISDRGHLERRGLKATGSKDIVVDDAFVPEHRSQSHLDYAENAPLPGCEQNDGALYRLPFSVVFNSAIASSMLGSARGFVALWVELTRDRKLMTGPAADDPLVQRRIAEATWMVDGAIARLRGDAEELWQMAEARVSGLDGAARPVPLQHEPRLPGRR
jgi:alkylation response protein AidB-like acyl-CoA dehydrogenase